MRALQRKSYGNETRLMTLDENADYLRMSRSRARTEAELAGALIKRGKSIRIDRKRLDEYLDGLTRV